MHGFESSKSCGNGELSSAMPHQSRHPAAVSKSTTCGGIVTCEVITLCVIITTVCTLLSLPVIFYHLPLSTQQPGVSTCIMHNIRANVMFIIIL